MTFAAALPSPVLCQVANRPCSLQRLQFPPDSLPVHLLDGPATYLQALGQFRWFTPFDRSTREYSRCWSVRLGRRPGKALRSAAFAWPATERSLIEFRRHSLKASTIEIRSLPVDVDVDVSESSVRDRNSTPARCRSSITCGP